MACSTAASNAVTQPVHLTTNTNVRFLIFPFQKLVIFISIQGGIVDILTASGVSILSWVALRILTQGKLEDFLSMRGQLDDSNGHVRIPPRQPDDYTSIYHLATLSDMRQDKDFFDRTFMAVFLFQCLRASGFLPTAHQRYDEDALDISEDELYIGSLLLRHLQLLQFNAHEIHEFV